MRYLATLIFFASLAFAGQSLSVTVDGGSWPQTARADNLPYRVEFWIHGMGSGPGNQYTLFTTGGVSFYIQWNGSTQLWMGATHRTIDTSCTINPSAYSANGVLVRYQYDPSIGTYGQESCEVWGYDTGTRSGTVKNYTGTQTNNSTTGQVNGQTANGEFKLGFLRGYSTLVGVNSNPPVPADPNGDLFNFKFEGNLTNDSGTNMTFTNPVYASSPAALVRAQFLAGSPNSQQKEYTSAIPGRAGYPVTLQSTSISTSDSYATPPSIFWQQLSGPSTLRFSSRTATSTTVTGCVFGAYMIRLTAVDGAASSTKDMEMSCVATDSNGVVVQKNSTIDAIFGPMIAVGRNPVPYADRKIMQGIVNTATRYSNAGFASNGLRAWKAGTVAYNHAGASANLTNSPGTSGTSLQFANLSAFDTSSFPILVIVPAGGNLYNASGEWIPICSSSGGTTLVVCSGGRGSFGRAAKNLASGDTVYQFSVTGTGTAFLTDLCPAGVGPSGPIVFTSSNVSATNNSTTLTLNSGDWPANYTSYWITVAGAGLDAVTGRWFGSVASVSGANLTLDRAYPGTTGTVTVYVLSSAGMAGSPYFERGTVRIPTGTGATPRDADLIHGIYGWCGSNTKASYMEGGLEKWGVPNETVARYTRNDGVWAVNNVFALAYYDEVLAQYAGHFASGRSDALDSARALGDIWIHLDEYGSCCGQPNLLGAMVNAAIDGQPGNAAWPKIRDFLTGYFATGTPYEGSFVDMRSGISYPALWLAAGAILDPDVTNRNTWLGRLQNLYDALTNYAGAGFNWPLPVFADGTTDVTVTNGSATVTSAGGLGKEFDSRNCGYIGAGVAQVSGDKRTVTVQSGDNFTGSNRQVIFRSVRSDGSSYPMDYTGSGSTITLATDYPFTTGVNVNYWVWDRNAGAIQAEGYNFAIRSAALNGRQNHPQTYYCKYDSATQVTLDRPWGGTSFSDGVAGAFLTSGANSVQPFVVGIAGSGIRLAEIAARNDGQTTLANNLKTFTNNVAGWLFAADGSGGYLPADKGIYYQRGGPCDPAPVPMTASCSAGTSNNRVNSTEAHLTIAQHFINTGNTAIRDVGDAVYRATYNTPNDPTVWGIAADAYDPLGFTDYLTNGRTFWGNTCGMGFCFAWPAAREGGVAPAQTRTLLRTFTLPSGAADAQFIITAPSGAQTTTTCTVSPCSVTMDARQGQHRLQVRYRTGGGASLYLTPAVDAEIITVN